MATQFRYKPFSSRETAPADPSVPEGVAPDPRSFQQRRAERPLEEKFGGESPESAQQREAKTFRSLILDEMPGRISKARTRLLAGDREGGLAELKAVEDFRSTYTDELAEFASFKGTNRLGQRIAEQSLSLSEGRYMDELQPLLLSDELKNKAIDRQSIELGVGADLSELRHKAFGTDADPFSVAAMQYANREAQMSAAPRGRQGGQAVPADAAGQPMQATPAGFPEAGPAGGFDPDQWAGFFKQKGSWMRKELGDDVLAALGTTGFVDNLGKSFQAGGADNGDDLLAIGLKAATAGRNSGLDAQGQAALFSQGIDAGRAFVSRFKPQDPVLASRASAVFNTLASGFSGEEIVRRAPQFAQIASAVSDHANRFLASGELVSEKTLGRIAQAEYHRTFRPGDPVPPELTGTVDLLNQRALMRNSITARPTPQAPNLAPGVVMMSMTAGSRIDAAMARTMEKGGADIKGELRGEVDTLARDLVAGGMQGRDESRVAASLILSAAASGMEVDFANLPATLRKIRAVRGLEAEAKKLGQTTPANQPPTDTATVEKTAAQKVEALARSRVAPGGLPAADPVTGKAFESKAAAEAWVTQQAGADPDAKLFADVMKIRADDGIKAMVKGAGRRLINTPFNVLKGESTVAEQVGAQLKGPAEKLVGTKSGFVRFLTEQVPVTKVRDAETIDQAVSILTKELADGQKILGSALGENAEQVARDIVTEFTQSLSLNAKGKTLDLPFVSAVGGDVAQKFLEKPFGRISWLGKAGDLLSDVPEDTLNALSDSVALIAGPAYAALANQLEEKALGPSAREARSVSLPELFAKRLAERLMDTGNPKDTETERLYSLKQKVLNAANALVAPAAPAAAPEQEPEGLVDVSPDTLVVNNAGLVGSTLKALDKFSERVNQPVTDVLASEYFKSGGGFDDQVAQAKLPAGQRGALKLLALQRFQNEKRPLTEIQREVNQSLGIEERDMAARETRAKREGKIFDSQLRRAEKEEGGGTPAETAAE